MRVVHVARRMTLRAWGGTESVVAALAREQRRAGHDATVMCTAALDRPGRDEVLGVPVERFRYSYARVPLCRAAAAALDAKGGNPLSPGLLWALLRTPSLSVIHCHTMQRLAAHARWAARRRGIPYVVQLHGGEFAVPRDEARGMLAPVRRTLDWGKVPAALLGVRRFLADAAVVLVLSEEERSRAQQALPATRVELLPNGVDAARFASGDGPRARARFGVPAGAPLLLTVARVDPQKGQELLPDVLAAVPGAHAVLAGPVTVPGYDDEIRARAAELGVGDRLHLVGALAPDGSDLADLYHAATAFVLPSRHEPFGIVVLEAWAAGAPVVATAVGGLAELVRPDRTGVLVPSGDAGALAVAVRRVVEQPAFAQALRRAGSAEVAAKYAWPTVAARLEALYREVGAGRRE